MTSSTNSYFYPVLEDDRFDYVNADLYEVELVTDNEYVKQTENTLVLKYTVKGDNLISQLINAGEAKLVCTTVVKSTMYRETITESKEIKKGDIIEVVQIIPLQDTLEIQQFAPMIIYVGEDKNITLDSEKMGLDLFWDKKEITLYKGSILAKDGWRETEYSASDLLSIRRDENLEHSFNVIIDTKEGGRFLAYVNAELYDNMNKQKQKSLAERAHFNSIATHMLCVGFMKLRDDFKEGSDDLTNFNAIKRKLKSEGYSSWEDPDFDPNKTACHFFPHKLVMQEDENE